MLDLNDKELLQAIKESAFKCYDTLEVMSTAIETQTLNSAYLLAPVEIIQKELQNEIIKVIDNAFEI